MRVLFLFNPAAGHRSSRRWKTLSAGLSAKRPQDEVWLTRKRGDGVRLTRQGMEEGFEAVIAVGGDGTLNEAVNGYLSASEALRNRTALGTFPLGSGCDFARSLGIEAEESSLLAMLDDPEIRKIDAGKVTCSGSDGKEFARFFINAAAFGLASDVARNMESYGKPLGSAASYIASSLAALLQARPWDMELRVDGGAAIQAGYYLVTLANTQFFGSGMRIAPKADMEDGFLDLVAVAGLSKWKLLARFPSLYAGRHLEGEGVSWRRVKRVEASSGCRLCVNIDGEAVGSLPAVFEIIPGAVPFLCPKSAKK